MILRILVIVVLGMLALPAHASAASANCGTLQGTPAYQHVIIIMDENVSYANLAPSAPYISTLMRNCSSWEAAGATDPSQPNYMAATQGYFAPCIQCASGSDNIFHELDQAGRGWRAQEESMPSPCSGSTQFPYKRGHNPPYWYTDIRTTTCRTQDVPGTSLPDALPALTWVTPNICHDMHWKPECGSGSRIAVGDAWLQHFLMADVFPRADYQQGKDLIIITWDEGNEAGSTWFKNCADPAYFAGHGSCKVATILISPYRQSGAHPWQSGHKLFSHYSILRSVEKLFGVSLPSPSPVPAFWSSYQKAPLYPNIS
jgi:hypothetical protein